MTLGALDIVLSPGSGDVSSIFNLGSNTAGIDFDYQIKKSGRVAKHAAYYMGILFTMSWLLLLIAILWVSGLTGYWQLSQVMIQDRLSGMESWERTCIQLLLIFSVLIPAGQWPFQRWLLDLAVAPTPVSAVMHAGIVNAGGIILTLFAPLFNQGNVAPIIC